MLKSEVLCHRVHTINLNLNNVMHQQLYDSTFVVLSSQWKEEKYNKMGLAMLLIIYIYVYCT